MASVSQGTPDDAASAEAEEKRSRQVSSSPSNNASSNTSSDSSSKSASLTKVIDEQVTNLEAEAIALESSEVQSRVRHLIRLIKANLQSRTLDKKTQRELARLLSLTPTLDGRHAQQLALLDLAVSILLEPHGSGANRTASKLEGAKLNGQSDTAKNLFFVRETRRQISQQSRPYPDLLRTIFITGDGTPYIRLISGLGWFFLLFVIAPLTVAGLTFAVRDVAGFIEAQDKIEELEGDKTVLSEESRRQRSQIETLIRRRDALAAQLGRTNSQVAAIAATPADGSSTEASTTETPTANTPSSSTSPRPSTGSTPSSASAQPPSAQPSPPSFVTVPIQVLDNIQTEIETELRSNLNREAATSEAQRVAETQRDSEKTPASETETRDEADVSVSIATDNGTFTATFSLILLAVAMGALGSTISVIVRANTFIRQAQENENDLFLTGFFRPFVGMSFAIFCVALVEAGIFSGIFDLSNRKNTNRTYFYVAIAFVAGFSERLVRDVVIKTEDTIAGPNKKDDQWT